MEIIIDSRIKYNYSTYFIQGFYELFGKSSTFQFKPIKELSFSNEKQYNSGLPCILKDLGKTYKIFIDFEDVAKIETDRYEWCDIYAKINSKFGWTERYDKLYVIGPSFGITIDSRLTILKDCFFNYVRSKSQTNTKLKTYLRDYIYSFVRRRPLYLYEQPTTVDKNYIFHASTLWYNEFAKSSTNRYRGEFLKACSKAGLIIEGGLFFIGETPNVLKEMPDYGRYKIEYKDFIYNKRLSMDEYINKTKKSLLVFNTPAVCECHGWKLSEYLCMGKAIISTPLTRAMPEEGLQHGINIHFVESIDDIYDAIIQIKNDDEYRKKLEIGAREYYEKYLTPKRMIGRLIEKTHRI